MRIEFGPYKRATPKTLAKVFDNTLVYLEKYPAISRDFCKRFNELLDNMLSEDAFGTEGQCDPRGDHRS